MFQIESCICVVFNPLSPNSAQNQFSPKDIIDYHEQRL